MATSNPAKRSRFIVATTAFITLLQPRHMPAQVPAAPALSLEVTTVKPGHEDAAHSNLNFSAGHIIATNMTLLYLIKQAYGLNTNSDDQIVGALPWVRTITFDINAKEDEATAAAMKNMPFDDIIKSANSLLRSLLEERFKLKVHMVALPRTVAALVLAKGGSKLTPVTPCQYIGNDQPCQAHEWQGLHNDSHAGHIEGRGATTAMLATVLSTQPDIGGRLVVDATGLTGKYNFDLQYTPDGAAESNGPSLFSAIQEQLGLKLETKKLPITVLVIDQVEHPSVN